MDTLGVWLRQTREAKGNALEEAAAATRIRPRFLEALEAGDFAAFPGGDVQVRGFLRIYARYLGLSADEVLGRYDAQVHGVEAPPPGAPAETRPASPARSATRPAVSQPPGVSVSISQPGWMSLERLMTVGIVLIVVLAIVTGVGYLISRNVGQEAAAPGTATTTAPAEAVPSPTAAATPAPPAVTPTFPANPQGGVTLTLEATEHVWVRVTRDGQTPFEGLMAADQVETWSGQEVIVVDTGNGAGLLVTVNGQPQGRMCGRAQVCTRAWGPTGELAAP
jgi:pyruvate/2-oxoglutarate dehydrogenase complex dihydrolipoamide acyltransferase (E2) component